MKFKHDFFKVVKNFHHCLTAPTDRLKALPPTSSIDGNIKSDKCFASPR